MIFLRAGLSLALLAGILLGIALPKALERFPGYEIGRWPVYTADHGFMAVEPMFAPPEAPFFFAVEMRTAGPLRAGKERIVLELTLLAPDGTQILRHGYGFPNPPARESPQSEVHLYRDSFVLTEPLDGRHKVEITAGPQAEASIRSVELVLNAGAYDLDPRLQPLGFILLAVGGAGLLASFRRRSEARTPKPPPRWGRSGAGEG